MAIQLEANYSKKLGLPGYSSHQFSITVRTEIDSMDRIEAESTRLYSHLQENVDREIQQPGFVPEPSSGSNAHSNNGHSHSHTTNGTAWKCTAKQKELILKITEDNRLQKSAVDNLAQDRFGKGVIQLNKLEASGLIEELLETHGPKKPTNGRTYPRR
jgi:hypothetical protein